MLEILSPLELRSNLLKLLKVEDKLLSRLNALQSRGCGENYEKKLELWKAEHSEIRDWARQMLEKPELAAARGCRGSTRWPRMEKEDACDLSFIPFDLFSDYVEMRIIGSISSYVHERMLPALCSQLGPVAAGRRVVRANDDRTEVERGAPRYGRVTALELVS